MDKCISFYCDGTWMQSASGNKFEMVNPWNGEKLGTLVEPTKAEVEMVVKNAVDTFETARLSPEQRFEILSRTAALMKARLREIATVIAKDCGKPIRDAEVEVKRAITTFQVSAEEAKRMYGYTEELSAPEGMDYTLGFTVREPVGVVCAITPFNFPLNLAAHKIAPALAAGNTVVFKPSEQTVNTAVLLVDLLAEAGLPKGFLNMVVGTGANVGEMLLADERINFYSFTGSARVGELIKRKSGYRRVALELGSNAPNIVHHDADIEQAAKLLVKASFVYAGQACISAQRIYVHAQVVQPFLERFVELTKQLRVGDPLLDTTDVGPVINASQADRIESWINEAVVAGAKLVHGGERSGTLITPAIVANADPNSKIMCEEVFGPVVNIHAYENLEQLVEQVNASKYGLQAGVFTSNVHTAIELARKCKVGGVNINNASVSRADTMPYGGVKQSGIGREGPRFAMEEMTEVKVITLNAKYAD